MSGMICFGYDFQARENLSAAINISYWYAFGLLIDAALGDKYPEIHETIKNERAIVFDTYEFTSLDRSSLKLAINAIRYEISTWADLTPEQLMSKRIWERYFEPWVIRDVRFQPNIEGDSLEEIFANQGIAKLDDQ